MIYFIFQHNKKITTQIILNSILNLWCLLYLKLLFIRGKIQSNMNRQILIILLSIWGIGLHFFPILVKAEVIKLKSGNVIEGKIIAETEEYIKVEYYGVELTYYLSDIASIERKQSSREETVKPPEGNLYVNELIGFKITVPVWFEIERNSRQLQFTKEKEIKKEIFSAQFIINIDEALIFPEANSSLEYAKKIIDETMNNAQGKAEVINYPCSVNINGFDAATLRYKLLGADNAGNQSLVISQYVYHLGEDVVVLMFVDGDKTFETNFAGIKPNLESFERLSVENTVGYLEETSAGKLFFSNIDNQQYYQLVYKMIDGASAINSYKSSLLIKDNLNEGLADFGYKSVELTMSFSEKNNFEFEVFDFYTGTREIWRIVGDEVYIKTATWVSLSELLSKTNENERSEIQDTMHKRKQAYNDLAYGRYLDLLSKEVPAEISESPGSFIVLRFNLDKADFLPFIDAEESVLSCDARVWIFKQDYTIRMVQATIEGVDKIGRKFIKEYKQYFTNYNLPFTLRKPLVYN